jgi:triosephosphate isomerase
VQPPLLIGAQKLFLSVSESVAFARELHEAVRHAPLPVDLLLCPSLLSLSAVADVLRGSAIAVGAQTFHHAEGGAHTGQVSLLDVLGLGVRFAMIGHWELRDEQGETDATVARKVDQCLAHAITPILCIGETAAERDAGHAHDVVTRQLAAFCGTAGPALDKGGTVILAYEPQWPLAAGEQPLRAAVRLVDATCASMREKLTDLLGPGPASRVRLLYGGGVNERTARVVLEELHIDGVLVGRASTRLPAFLEIAQLMTRSPAHSTS